MATADIGIKLNFNAVLDVASLNVILRSIKEALGPIGKDIKLLDAAKINEELRKVQSEAAQLVNTLKNAEEQTDKLGKSGSMLERLFKFNQITQAVTQVAGAFQSVLAVGNEYESTLAAVGAVTGQSGEGLNKLGAGARELAKEFGGSASDNLKSYQGILSKLGPQVAENSEALKSMGKTVNILSAASGDDAATSMNALVDTMLQLGLTTGDAAKDAATMTQVADALAASAKVGAAEIPQVAQSMLAVGVAAKGAKLDLASTTGAIQLLAVGGKTGSEAGVALRNVLGLMQKASGTAEVAMSKLGTSSKELGELLTTKGLDAALGKIKTGMDGLGSAAEKNATLMTIFGTENSAAAGILLDNLGQFNTFRDGIQSAVDAGATGADGAVAQAEARLHTAEAITKRIVAQVEDVYVGIQQTFGSGISAVLTATTQIAPALTSIASIKELIPDESINKVKDFALNILTKLLPGLFGQAAAQTAVAASATGAAAGMTATTAATTTAGAAAGASSTAFGTLWTTMLGPVGIAIAAFVAIAGALYLLYQNVESFRKVVDTAINFVVQAFNIVLPVIKKVGEVFVSLGGAIFNYLTLPMQIGWEIIKSVVSALFSFGDGTKASSGALKVLGDVFAWIGDKLNLVLSVLDGFKAGLNAIVGGIGPIVSAITKGDLTGAASAMFDAGKNAVGAFQNGMTDSYQEKTTEDLKNKIGKDLSEGITIAAKFEDQTDFTAMIGRYDEINAKIAELRTKQSAGPLTKEDQESLKQLQQEAENTAKKIAEIAPQTKANMTVVADESGKLKEVFTINTQAARDFANTQKTAFGKDVQQSQQDISKSLLQQAGIYDSQKNKLKEIAAAATEAAKAGKSDQAQKLIKEYEDLRVKVEENGKALVDNFNNAGKAGLLTQNAINGVAKSMSITGDEAKKSLITQALSDAAAKGTVADTEIAKIAQRFGISTDEAKKMLIAQQQQTAEAAKTAAEVKTIAASFDEAKKAADEVYSKSKADAATARLRLVEAEKSGNKDSIRLAQENVKSQTKAAQERYKITQNLAKVAKDNEIAIEGDKEKKKKEKEETAFQRVKKSTEYELTSIEQKLTMEKSQDILHGIRMDNDQTDLYFLQQKLDLTRVQTSELKKQLGIAQNLELKPENVPVKFKLEKNEPEQLREFINKLNIDILKQQSDIKKVELKLDVDAQKLADDMRKLKLQKLEQDVELGLVMPEDVIAEYQKDLAIVQTRMQEAIANNDAKAQSELLKQQESLNKSMEKIRSDAYKRENAKIDERAKKRKDDLTNQLKDQQDFNAKMNAALNSRSSKVIDQANEAALKDLENKKEQELITEQQYNEQKLALEQEIGNKKLALQAYINGRQMQAEREHSIALLEEEKLRLQEKRDLAVKNNDTKTAQDLNKQLDDVVKTLNDKQSVIESLTPIFQNTMNDFAEGLFEFDEAAMKAPLRNMLGILGGFLTKLASTKVVEVLLGSIIGAGGLPGMLATFLLKPIIEQGIGAIINPVISSITSFSTGGIVTQPTLAVVGDRRSSAGDQTEFILGSDQLSYILKETLTPFTREIKEGFHELGQKIDNISGRFHIAGNDLTTAVDRTRTANMRRIRTPFK